MKKRFLNATLLVSMSACINHKQVEGHEGHLAAFSSLRRIVGAGVRQFVVGEDASIKAIEALTAAQRATLIVTAENQQLSSLPGYKLKSIKIPMMSFKADPQLEIRTHAPRFTPRGASDVERNFPQKLLTEFGQTECGQTYRLPYHPESTVLHPILSRLKQKGAVVSSSSWEAFPSMSRSLFIVNDRRPDLPTLFTLKMGTNRVNGMRQDEKAYVDPEEITIIREVTERTSIPGLMDFFGLRILLDTVGVQLAAVGAKADDREKNYTLMVRDYSPLIKDKNYLYMPLDSFKWKGKPSPDGTMRWELDDGVFLSIGEENLKQFVYDLAFETGKFEAILLSNGYTTEYFHGQNVLVGIPLDPGNHARLGFRDIGDSEDLLPLLQKSATTLPKMNEANWCVALRMFTNLRERCFAAVLSHHQAGFSHVLEKMGFTADEIEKIRFLSVQGSQEPPPGKNKSMLGNSDRLWLSQRLQQVRAFEFKNKSMMMQSSAFCTMPQRAVMRRCLGKSTAS